MFYRLLFIALIACTFSTQAFAQAPAPSAKDLCAKAPEAERTECETALTEMQTAMGADLWAKFSTCAVTKDFSKSKGEDLKECFTPEIMKAVVDAMAKEPPPSSLPPAPSPANGSFYTPEELCSRAEETDRAACTEGLTEMKATIGDTYWTPFAACAVTKDFTNKADVMTCITPEMMEEIGKKMKEEKGE